MYLTRLFNDTRTSIKATTRNVFLFKKMCSTYIAILCSVTLFHKNLATQLFYCSSYIMWKLITFNYAKLDLQGYLISSP